MAIFIPSNAKAKDSPKGPEQQVLDAIRHQLDDSWKVIPNLFLAEHPKHFRGEADIVLIHDGVVILVEIKGGNISRDKNGSWSQNGRHLKSPIEQANGNFHAVKQYTKNVSGCFTMGDWCCIFPQSKFEEKSPEWNPEQIIDIKAFHSGIGVSLIKLYERIVFQQLPKLGSHARLNHEASMQLVNLLRPSIDGSLKAKDLVDIAEIEVSNLEKDQIDCLGVITSNPRVLLTGVAGSGKTVLGYLACIEKLKDSSSAQVAFVCCSDYLAKDIRSKVLASPYIDRFHVFSLSELTKLFWEKIIKRKTAFKAVGHCAFAHENYLESWALGVKLDLSNPRAIRGKLSELEIAGIAESVKIDLKSVYSSSPICNADLNLNGNQYDFIVIDEAQDFMFSLPELCYISIVVKGGLSKGNVLWIQDMYQSIRPFFLEYEPDLMPNFVPQDMSYVNCPLPKKNYRNPAGIVQLASYLNGEQSIKSLRNSTLTPDYEIIDCPNGSIGDALDSVLRSLRVMGIAAKDIAFITADGKDDSHFKQGSLHAGYQVVKVPASHEDEVLKLYKDVVRAFNLLESKGREFPVVILGDIPLMLSDYERNFMMLAITRAKAKLYILCGEERKNALLKIIKGNK
jgi:Nuclease-related domain